MGASVSFNPQLQTVAAGAFTVQSDGATQGAMLDDPVSLTGKLKSGIVSLSSASPIWGGCAVSIALPNGTDEALSIGAVLTLAAAEANVLGFTTYNQSTATIQSAQSPAPLAAAGMGINYFELGSGAQLWVQCDPTLASSLEGGVINPTVYWDFTNQKLISSGATALPVKVTRVKLSGSKIITYSSGTGYATWSYGAAALIEL